MSTRRDATWLASVVRDRRCASPGCSRVPIDRDARHVVHEANGGPTSLGDPVLLRRGHQALTHTTPWRVQADPVTRRPVRTPPPPGRDSDRFSYHPPSRPPPGPVA